VRTPQWVLFWTIAATGLAAHVAGGSRLFRPGPLAAPLAASAAAAFVLPFFAFRPRTAWVASLGTLAGVAAAILATEHLRGSRGVRKFAVVVIVTSLIVTAYGFLQYFGVDPYRWAMQFGGQRPFATFGNPNFLAGHFSVLALWAVVMFLSAGNPVAKAGWLALSFAWLLLVLVTQTRGAWIACGVAAAWLGWRTWTRDRERIAAQLNWLVVMGVLVVLTGAVAAIKNPDLAFRIADMVPRDMGQVAKRFTSMAAALLATRDHPLAGIGPGCFKHAFGMHMARAMPLGERSQFTHTYSEEFTHCDPLQILAETGVPAFGIFVWLVVAAVRVLRHATETRRLTAVVLLASGLALLVHAIFNLPMRIAPTAFMFWAGVGIAGAVGTGAGDAKRIAAAPGRKDREAPIPASAVPSERVSPVPLAAGLAGLAVGLLAALIFAASLYTRQGKDSLVRAEWLRARWALENGMRVDWDDRREAFFAASAYFNLKDYQMAVRLFEKDIERNPYYMDGHTNLGSTFGIMGRTAEATVRFKRAIELNPAYAEAYANLGVAYLTGKRRREAVEAFREALELEPDLALAQNGLVQAGGTLPIPGASPR
jgi:hypothetical protein